MAPRALSSVVVVVLSLVWLQPANALEASFRRGDVNADGRVDLTDPIFLFNWLFLGSDEAPPCLDAADANDSGATDISDGIWVLGWLYLGEAPPPAPGPESCGPDPTADELGCAAFTPCVTHNLWWDETWREQLLPPPIELLESPPQIGHPATARVRFWSSEPIDELELELRLLAIDDAGVPPDEMVVSLGRFLLVEPPVAAGENTYDLELIVSADLLPIAGREYALAGTLDPRDLVPETIEDPDTGPDDPQDPTNRGDNTTAIDDVPVVLSDELSAAPSLTLEDVRVDPDVLIFDVNELPLVKLDSLQGAITAVGYDPNGTTERLGRRPRTHAARAAFLAAVQDAAVEDFDEGFADGQHPHDLSFEPLDGEGDPRAATTASFLFAERIEGSQTVEGRYPTSGDVCLRMPVPAGMLDVDFESPQTAFGLQITDLGEAPDAGLTVWLFVRQGDGHRVIYGAVIEMPPMDPAGGEGSSLFFGVINDEPFDRVEIRIEGEPQVDGVGFDDFIAAPAAHLDPLAACPPDTDARLAAEIDISATGTETVETLELEIDLELRGPPELASEIAAVLADVRAQGLLPISTRLDRGSATLEAFGLEAAGTVVEIPLEEGGAETERAPGIHKTFHLEACPPSALVQAVGGLFQVHPELGEHLAIEVDLTARIATFDGEEHLGTEDNELRIENAVTLVFISPEPAPSREWTYSSRFGGRVVGGEIDFAAGVWVDSDGPLACARGEFDALLFGYRLDGLVDTCGRATMVLAENDEDSSTASLVFQMRNLTLGFEDGGVVTRHHVLYEKRGEVVFAEDGPPQLSFDFEIRDGEVATTPFQYETENGKWAFHLPGEGGTLVSLARSWAWCQSFVVVFVPVGFELEIGGEVAVEVDLEATRRSVPGASPVHELSLLAGPSIEFFGAGSVFFGACAPGPSSSNEPPGSEEADLGDCGRLAGATVDLTFLHFLVGPEAWARAWNETRAPEGDGVAFELGIDLTGRLTILRGALSLWIHYLAPKICWVRIFGRRVFPYICGFGCRKAAITIVSFPGFRWDVFDVEIDRIEDWLRESQAPPCPECPREEE